MREGLRSGSEALFNGAEEGGGVGWRELTAERKKEIIFDLSSEGTHVVYCKREIVLYSHLLLTWPIDAIVRRRTHREICPWIRYRHYRTLWCYSIPRRLPYLKLGCQNGFFASTFPSVGCSDNVDFRGCNRSISLPYPYSIPLYCILPYLSCPSSLWRRCDQWGRISLHWFPIRQSSLHLIILKYRLMDTVPSDRW